MPARNVGGAIASRWPSARAAAASRNVGSGAPVLAGLAVRSVLAAVRAELVQLDPVGVVPTVLLGDVVPVLAVHTRQRDLRTDVGAGHGTCLSSGRAGRAAPERTGPRGSRIS